MKQSSAAKANITFKIDADGEWRASVVTGAYTPGTAGGALTDAFKTGGSVQWAASAADITKDTPKSSAGDATALLTIDIASVFPDVKSSYIYAYCEGGKTLYVAYTADGNTKPASMPAEADFKAGTYAWDGNTAGITSDGITLGTAPALSLGTSSSST